MADEPEAQIEEPIAVEDDEAIPEDSTGDLVDADE